MQNQIYQNISYSTGITFPLFKKRVLLNLALNMITMKRYEKKKFHIRVWAHLSLHTLTRKINMHMPVHLVLMQLDVLHCMYKCLCLSHRQP